jgi:hypothetical protein
MPMLVVQVRVVDMGMTCRLVPMPMRVGLRHWFIMFVIMMLVMDMAMFMLQRVMLVFMAMAFCQMQPQANSH